MTEQIRELLADELGRVRERSFGLTTSVLDDRALTAQVSPLMSPLVWDLAHVGNYEELWLLRAATGAEPLRPEIDGLYDAFEHPRAERPALPLLPPKEARAYLATVRARVLDTLEHARFDTDDRLTRDAFVYRMVVQHEHMHDETMLATHQLRTDAALLDPGAPARAGRPGPAEVFVPGGPFTMGTDRDPWALDNERPAHTVDVPAFHLDAEPVSNARFGAFMAAGGYGEPRWWTTEGWEWRTTSGKRAPGFWTREGDGWVRRRFGRTEEIPPDEAVQHVCWYEADAYARWAGRRLPTEAEWDKAALWDSDAGRARRYPWGEEYEERHANLGQRALRPSSDGAYPDGASPYGARRMVGDVWEWTSSDFAAYPGFRAFPYREYSEVFFGPEYKVLRGGSWATHPLGARGTFRNWDYPIRRQIFAGFRTARDA
ncbi:ergothioneine biosynthesis protein EgtB [Actinomadura flavalba]|uniref:ergothioneine biosynthesis protein EgtB n=1 Tax=Actinomadura flavalba TaxID=1120938 RepID=UPI000367D189|nr:ergothioneine biosynthesis protein EgtB [Actinomadura flavalba]